MNIIELFLISLFCVLQSIFGVGVLLLGTPTFIIIGYSYFEVLNILLPYSILISILQIFMTQNKDFLFFKKILIFSIPTLTLGLILSAYLESKINYTYLIAFFLILFSLINIFNSPINKILKNLNLNLVILGFVHGISNLGGGILTIISSNLSKEKKQIRFYIASGYFIFALFQLLIVNIFFQKIQFDYLKYIWIPILIFIISNKVFNYINSKNYFYLINIFIFMYGLFLLLKN